MAELRDKIEQKFCVADPPITEKGLAFVCRIIYVLSTETGQARLPATYRPSRFAETDELVATIAEVFAEEISLCEQATWQAYEEGERLRLSGDVLDAWVDERLRTKFLQEER